jgi:amino acid transporter
VGRWGGTAVSLLVMISALAAINGMILTGARVYAMWGEDYPTLGWLANWRPSSGPTAAILVQSAIAVALIMLVGTQPGRDTFDAALGSMGLAGLPWGEKFSAGFETLVAGTAPIYWAFCLLTGVAVFVLRAADRGAARHYGIPLFPLPPLVLCATCAFMLIAALDHAGWLSLVGLVPMVPGVAILILIGSIRRRKI